MQINSPLLLGNCALGSVVSVYPVCLYVIIHKVISYDLTNRIIQLV